MHTGSHLTEAVLSRESVGWHPSACLNRVSTKVSSQLVAQKAFSTGCWFIWGEKARSLLFYHRTQPFRTLERDECTFVKGAWWHVNFLDTFTLEPCLFYPEPASYGSMVMKPFLFVQEWLFHLSPATQSWWYCCIAGGSKPHAKPLGPAGVLVQ